MSHVLDPNIAEALGIAELSQQDQLAFLSEHGDDIFSTAIARFEPLLTEFEHKQLQIFLAGNPEPEALLQFLARDFPLFLEILTAVTEEIQSEAEE